MISTTEQAVLLGPRKSLVGVITQPEASATRADLPAFVFLNSGIVHRVGTNRLTVGLSRALAATGYTVLRFDLSGIGDSAGRPDSLTPLQAGLADIREAIDSLQAQRHSRGIILAGLCSGADFSVLYAGSDPRVVGLVLLDPSIPRTTRYYVQHYATRLLRWRIWSSMISGRHPVWRAMRRRIVKTPTAARPEPGQPGLQSQEVRQALESAYRNAVVNQIRIYALFTAGIEDQHNYRRQLLDAFPAVSFGDLLGLEYFHDSDHMFTSEASRVRLTEQILNWSARTTFCDAR